MLHNKWLVTGSERDRKRFAKMRQSVRQEMRRAKNSCFQMKAGEAEDSKNSNKHVWQYIRDIQRG